MSSWLPRLLGIATAAYGTAVVVRPRLMLAPAGLSTEDPPPARLATLTRSLGARDIASGVAMALAPSPKALRTAIAVRVVSDLADTAFFGYALRGKPQQAKAVGIAASWATVCALSAVTVRKR